METIKYILQLNILFTVFIGLFHFLLRKNRDFQFNRFYLLAIAPLSIVLPLLNIPIFRQVTFLELPKMMNTPMVNTLSGEVAQAANFSSISLINWGYMLVSALFIVFFAIRLYRLLAKVSHLKANAIYDPQKQVFVSQDIQVPFTFLRWSFIPKSIFQQEEEKMVIAHEGCHAKDLHSLDILLAELMSCVLFLNPLNKTYKKYISDNHEYMADAVALQKEDSSTYTNLLIRQSLSDAQLSMASYFSKPSILNRINMMKTTQTTKRKMYLALAMTFVISALIACDYQAEEEIAVIEDTKTQAEAIQDVDGQTIFSIVEEEAEPAAGIQDFYDFIGENMDYPQKAKEAGAEGAVFLQFVIEKDGSITNITPVKGIGYGCDEAAIAAMAAYGKWLPGKQGGEPVRTRRIIPIRFILNW